MRAVVAVSMLAGAAAFVAPQAGVASTQVSGFAHAPGRLDVRACEECSEST
jgi:hypothetical protein